MMFATRSIELHLQHIVGLLLFDTCALFCGLLSIYLLVMIISHFLSLSRIEETLTPRSSVGHNKI